MLHARSRKYGRLPTIQSAHGRNLFTYQTMLSAYWTIPRTLLRADKPSSRQGCVELLRNSYYKGVSLSSRIPVIRKLSTSFRIVQWSVYSPVGPYGTYSRVARPSTGPRRQFRRSIGTAQYAATIGTLRNRAVLRCVRHQKGIMRITRRVAHLSCAPAIQ